MIRKIMDKFKTTLSILAIGITIGAVVVVILVFVVGARPKGVTVGGVEFEIPTATSQASPNSDTQPDNQSDNNFDNNADSIAGNWKGTVIDDGGSNHLLVEIHIEKACEINETCGTINLPELPCSGKLKLVKMQNGVFTFIEKDVTGADFCVPDGQDTLQLLPDGTLSRNFKSVDGSINSQGIPEPQ